MVKMTEIHVNDAELREVSAQIIHHNRRISECVREVAAYYRGDRTAPVPSTEQLLEKQLNAKCNGADRLLRALGDACKKYPQGQCPKNVLNVLHHSTMQLIELLESVYRTSELNVSKTVLDDCHNYLTIPDKHEISPEQNAHNIDKCINRLIRRFCQNSDAFYNRNTDVINIRASAKPSRGSRNSRRGSALHGKRTRTMRQQFDDFKDFLLSHPISERKQGASLNARAKQFWYEHEQALAKAAACTGEKRGYPNARALASAYRSSRKISD